ncbi:Imm8 family immunity protein [Nocardia sp. NPDC051052]|uniref:Imm8 family immunity protein n=1 Tax=Nocardia sp. NPDC051052 TaxID=3364322 RepID=UPI0037A4FF8D
MRAEIRELLTPDIDSDTFVPDDPDRFCFLVQMLAGPAGDEGEESFQFEVCTPGWLSERIERDGPINGRHYVIVNNFHWPTLQNYFERLVTRIWGDNWREIATELSRYGGWEFEDYTAAASGPTEPPERDR